MAEKIQGRPWQPHEDALLLNAIHSTQGDIDWRVIAKSVPDRTNKACRKRWLHSLCPTVKKTAWTQAEDDTLLRLYGSHGPKWALIARAIPGRTDDACSKRYREALDPSLKRDEWTAEEDTRLIELQVSLRGKWGQIGPAMGRSGLGCRNRWRLLERKRASEHRTTAAKTRSLASTSTTTETQAGPSTLQLMQPPAEQQISHWGEGLLGWNTQYQDIPDHALSYEQTQPGTSLSFFATDTGQHIQSHDDSPNDFQMDTLPDSFASGEFFERTNFMQPQPTHQHSPQLNLHEQEYRVSAPFDYLSSGALVEKRHSTDQTYIGAHKHVPDFAFGGTFASRILDSQIDPRLMHGTEDSAQARPLPQYPPRVVSASQRTSSLQQPPAPPASPSPFSVPNSPRISPTTSAELEICPSALVCASPTSRFLISVTIPGSTSNLIAPSAPSLQPIQSHSPPADVSEGPSHLGDGSPPHSRGVPSREPSPNPDPVHHGERVPPHLEAARLDPLVHSQSHPTPPPLANFVPTSDPETTPATEGQSVSQDTPHDRARKKPFLSAFLPASSDPTVLAYACGMSDCWSNVNYATSSELAEHIRTAHPTFTDILSDSDLKPYRCSLTGCNKSWKSLNGLQYHLQVSRDHFRQALASARPVPSESQADGQGQKKGRKTHPCTHPGCTNVYKQLAGLRYHLKHGHLTNLPIQLEAVPPALAKKVGERGTKG